MSANNQPFKAVIGGKPVICNPVLEGFELLKKASSNVDYFGISRSTGQLFIQFNNGTCFLYSGVPIETLEAAKEAESIGKFFHSAIKNKLAIDEPIADLCIKPDDQVHRLKIWRMQD